MPKSKAKSKKGKKRTKRAASSSPAQPDSAHRVRLHRHRSVAHFIHEEIQTLIDTVNFRLAMLLDVWSKHRSREPFLKTLETRIHEIPAAELLLLEPATLSQVKRFCRYHSDLVLYLSFTEDMVLKLEDNVKDHLKKMLEVHEVLEPALAEEIRLVEAEIFSCELQDA